MTNKEFEDKKQDIFKNLDKALGFLQNEDLYKCSNIIWDTMKDLKQLQPPKPPTCATCAYRNAVTDDLTLGMKYTYVACINKVMLHNLGIKFLRVDQLTIEPAKEFGCVFHSDYEVAE